MTRRGVLLAALSAPACAALPESPRCAAAPGPAVFLLDAGWHTEIGLPPWTLPPPLGAIFPEAALVFFGFGKRHFMLAERPGPAEWLAGPFPGEAAMQVTAWHAPPARALRLPVAPGHPPLGLALLASFAPGPVLIAQRPGRRFFQAARGYSLAYTCNSWTAEMLAAAGLPVRAEGVVRAGGVMGQATRLPGVCQAAPAGLSPTA
jgi:hypothetical protein